MERVTGKKQEAGAVVKALVLAYFVTVVILLILAFVMLKVQPDVGKTKIGILAAYVLSCFVGGWYAGRKVGRRRFLAGLLVGILYFVILFLVSGLGERKVQSDLVQSALAFVLCACGGMLGGMLS